MGHLKSAYFDCEMRGALTVLIAILFLLPIFLAGIIIPLGGEDFVTQYLLIPTILVIEYFPKKRYVIFTFIADVVVQYILDPVVKDMGDIIRLIVLAIVIAILFLRKEQNLQLAQKLEETSYIDSLTQVKNRRYFDAIMKQLWANRQPCALVLFDIDNFKVINDTMGHGYGDRILQEVSSVIRSSVRAVDVISRVGGDEFAVLLPFTSNEDAVVAAERIRTGMALVPMAKKITISVGVLQLDYSNPLDASYNAADQALYQAKHNGRNQVVLYKRKPE